jgi:hypothetical protein
LGIEKRRFSSIRLFKMSVIIGLARAGGQTANLAVLVIR